MHSILWIDSDLDFILLVRRALRSKGVSNPVVCLNCEELGRSYLSQFSKPNREGFPCLIVVELRLPIAADLAFVKWIRERKRFDGVPVLLISNDVTLGTTEAQTLGATDFWMKRWDREALAALADRIVREWI